jgi:hypothetical protein
MHSLPSVQVTVQGLFRMRSSLELLWALAASPAHRTNSGTVCRALELYRHAQSLEAAANAMTGTTPPATAPTLIPAPAPVPAHTSPSPARAPSASPKPRATPSSQPQPPPEAVLKSVLAMADDALADPLYVRFCLGSPCCHGLFFSSPGFFWCSFRPRSTCTVPCWLCCRCKSKPYTMVFPHCFPLLSSEIYNVSDGSDDSDIEGDLDTLVAGGTVPLRRRAAGGANGPRPTATPADTTPAGAVLGRLGIHKWRPDYINFLRSRLRSDSVVHPRRLSRRE